MNMLNFSPPYVPPTQKRVFVTELQTSRQIALYDLCTQQEIEKSMVNLGEKIRNAMKIYTSNVLPKIIMIVIHHFIDLWHINMEIDNAIVKLGINGIQMLLQHYIPNIENISSKWQQICIDTLFRCPNITLEKNESTDTLFVFGVGFMMYVSFRQDLFFVPKTSNIVLQFERGIKDKAQYVQIWKQKLEIQMKQLQKLQQDGHNDKKKMRAIAKK